MPAGDSAAKVLLKENPSLVNDRDAQGNTPLHYAAFTGHKDIAETLIAYHADVNAKDHSGHTPAYWALVGPNQACPCCWESPGELPDLVWEAEGKSNAVHLLLSYLSDKDARVRSSAAGELV